MEMMSFQRFFLATLASITLVNAEFYIIRTSQAVPPNCVGEAGCAPEPPTTGTSVIGVNDFSNCDALGMTTGADIDGWTDPVCPASGQQGGQPFATSTSDGNNVCGLTNQGFYFRVQASNPGQLDAATDPDFNNIVANCYKQANCGDFGTTNCPTPAQYTAVYRCDAQNGSAC